MRIVKSDDENFFKYDLDIIPPEVLAEKPWLKHFGKPPLLVPPKPSVHVICDARDRVTQPVCDAIAKLEAIFDDFEFIQHDIQIRDELVKLFSGCMVLPEVIIINDVGHYFSLITHWKKVPTATQYDKRLLLGDKVDGKFVVLDVDEFVQRISDVLCTCRKGDKHFVSLIEAERRENAKIIWKNHPGAGSFVCLN